MAPAFCRAASPRRPAATWRSARELPRVGLDDALKVLVVLAAKRDERYARAAAPFARRVIHECDLRIDDARRLLALVEVLPAAPDAAGEVLRRYCG